MQLQAMLPLAWHGWLTTGTSQVWVVSSIAGTAGHCSPREASMVTQGQDGQNHTNTPDQQTWICHGSCGLGKLWASFPQVKHRL